MKQFSFIDLFEPVLVTGRQHYRCVVRSCIYSKTCYWRWASLSPETCREDSYRSIKRSINESYCILLVAHIVITFALRFKPIGSSSGKNN